MAAGNTITVGPEPGPGVDHTVIQDAINGSVDGDTVFVLNGTYLELLTINSSISLIGANSSNVIIDGGLLFDVITVTAENVTIANLTVRNSNQNIPGMGGVHVDASNCLIFECNIVDNRNGIVVKDTIEPSGTIAGTIVSGCRIEGNQWGVNGYLNSSEITVEDCIIVNNTDGVQFWASDDGAVRNCTFSGNLYSVDITSSNGTKLEGLDISDSLYYGIQMSNGYGITVHNCTLIDTNSYGLSVSNCFNITLMDVVLNGSSFSLAGSDTDHFATHTIENCTIDGEEILYQIGQENMIIDDVVGPLYLIDSRNVTVKNLDRTSQMYGIIIVNSTDTSVLNTTFRDNRIGITAFDCINLSVLNCTFTNTTYRSISISGGYGATLHGNLISNGTGVKLDATSEHVLIDNVLVNSYIQMYGDELGHFLGTWTGNTVYDEDVLYIRDQVAGTVPTNSTFVYMVNCSNIIKTGLNVTRERYDLSLYYCRNITISGSAFTGNVTAVELYNSSDCMVEDCILEGASTIRFEGCANSSVRECSFDTSTDAIRIYDSADISVLENSLRASGDGVLISGSVHCTIADNEAPLCQFDVHESSSCVIRNNSFSNLGPAVWVYGSDLIVIEENHFSRSSRGIHLRDSSNCTILRNTIEDGSTGIQLEDTFGCLIYGNVIRSNSGGSGIYLDGANWNVIEKNFCTECTRGIMIYRSHNNTVTNNTCNNGTDGIQIASATNNAITFNTLLSNWHGINGTGTNNTFLNNTVEDRVAPDPPTYPDIEDDEEDVGIQIKELLCVISLFVFVILMLASVLAPKKKKQSWDRRKEKIAGPGGPKDLKRTGGAGVPARTKKTVTMRPKRDNYLETKTEFPGRKKR